jgi:hypothetical protein
MRREAFEPMGIFARRRDLPWLDSSSVGMGWMGLIFDLKSVRLERVCWTLSVVVDTNDPQMNRAYRGMGRLSTLQASQRVVLSSNCRGRLSILLGLLLLAALCSHGIAKVEAVQSWVRRYDGPSHMNDQPTALKVDSKGDVFITGANYDQAMSDICTVRYDGRTGALLWERVYDGPATGDDAPHSMALDGAGNVLVAGRSGNGTAKWAYLAKYDGANGTLLWEWRATGSGLRVAVDSKGDVLCARATTNGFSSSKHTAADGNLMQNRPPQGPPPIGSVGRFRQTQTPAGTGVIMEKPDFAEVGPA